MEFYEMFHWFNTKGYQANIPELRRKYNGIEIVKLLWAERDAKREKRFEAKLQRQARQRGYKLVPIEEKPYGPSPLSRSGVPCRALAREARKQHCFRTCQELPSSRAISPIRRV
jgi:hypothetical protein